MGTSGMLAAARAPQEVGSEAGIVGVWSTLTPIHGPALKVQRIFGQKVYGTSARPRTTVTSQTRAMARHQAPEIT